MIITPYMFDEWFAIASRAGASARSSAPALSLRRHTPGSHPAANKNGIVGMGRMARGRYPAGREVRRLRRPQAARRPREAPDGFAL